MCGSLDILWPWEWKLAFSRPVATAEFPGLLACWVQRFVSCLLYVLCVIAASAPPWQPQDCPPCLCVRLFRGQARLCRTLDSTGECTWRLSLSRLRLLVPRSLGPSVLLQMTLSCCFHGRIKLHCVCAPHPLCPLACQRTPGQPPCLGCCEHRGTPAFSIRVQSVLHNVSAGSHSHQQTHPLRTPSPALTILRTPAPALTILRTPSPALTVLRTPAPRSPFSAHPPRAHRSPHTCPRAHHSWTF